MLLFETFESLKAWQEASSSKLTFGSGSLDTGPRSSVCAQSTPSHCLIRT